MKEKANSQKLNKRQLKIHMAIERKKVRTRLQQMHPQGQTISTDMINEEITNMQCKRITSFLPTFHEKSRKIFARNSLGNKNHVVAQALRSLPSQALKKHVCWLTTKQQDAKSDLSLTEEIQLFADYVGLTDIENQARQVLLSDMEEAVRLRWPDATVVPFGSYAANLSIFFSDIDAAVLSNLAEAWILRPSRSEDSDDEDLNQLMQHPSLQDLQQQLQPYVHNSSSNNINYGYKNSNDHSMDVVDLTPVHEDTLDGHPSIKMGVAAAVGKKELVELPAENEEEEEEAEVVWSIDRSTLPNTNDTTNNTTNNTVSDVSILQPPKLGESQVGVVISSVLGKRRRNINLSDDSNGDNDDNSSEHEDNSSNFSDDVSMSEDYDSGNDDGSDGQSSNSMSDEDSDKNSDENNEESGPIIKRRRNNNTKLKSNSAKNSENNSNSDGEYNLTEDSESTHSSDLYGIGEKKRALLTPRISVLPRKHSLVSLADLDTSNSNSNGNENKYIRFDDDVDEDNHKTYGTGGTNSSNSRNTIHNSNSHSNTIHNSNSHSNTGNNSNSSSSAVIAPPAVSQQSQDLPVDLDISIITSTASATATATTTGIETLPQDSLDFSNLIDLSSDTHNTKSPRLLSSYTAANLRHIPHESKQRQRKIQVLRFLTQTFRLSDWSQCIELRHRAKVPIIHYTHRSGLDADVSLGLNQTDTLLLTQAMLSMCGETVLRQLSSLLKVFLHQLQLDEPFSGGLGSFKLYVLITAHCMRHPELLAKKHNRNVNNNKNIDNNRNNDRNFSVSSNNGSNSKNNSVNNSRNNSASNLKDYDDQHNNDNSNYNGNSYGSNTYSHGEEQEGEEDEEEANTGLLLLTFFQYYGRPSHLHSGSEVTLKLPVTDGHTTATNTNTNQNKHSNNNVNDTNNANSNSSISAAADTSLSNNSASRISANSRHVTVTINFEVNTMIQYVQRAFAVAYTTLRNSCRAKMAQRQSANNSNTNTNNGNNNTNNTNNTSNNTKNNTTNNGKNSNENNKNRIMDVETISDSDSDSDEDSWESVDDNSDNADENSSDDGQHSDSEESETNSVYSVSDSDLNHHPRQNNNINNNSNSKKNSNTTSHTNANHSNNNVHSNNYDRNNGNSQQPSSHHQYSHSLLAPLFVSCQELAHLRSTHLQQQTQYVQQRGTDTQRLLRAQLLLRLIQEKYLTKIHYHMNNTNYTHTNSSTHSTGNGNGTFVGWEQCDQALQTRLLSFVDPHRAIPHSKNGHKNNGYSDHYNSSYNSHHHQKFDKYWEDAFAAILDTNFTNNTSNNSNSSINNGFNDSKLANLVDIQQNYLVNSTNNSNVHSNANSAPLRTKKHRTRAKSLPANMPTLSPAHNTNNNGNNSKRQVQRSPHNSYNQSTGNDTSNSKSNSYNGGSNKHNANLSGNSNGFGRHNVPSVLLSHHNNATSLTTYNGNGNTTNSPQKYAKPAPQETLRLLSTQIDASIAVLKEKLREKKQQQKKQRRQSYH